MKTERPRPEKVRETLWDVTAWVLFGALCLVIILAFCALTWMVA